MAASPLPDAPQPAQVTAADTPSLRVLAGLATAVVVIAALYFARDVLVPIMLAVLLSFLLAPLVALLRRLRAGRVPSVILAVLVALGVIVGLGTLIGAQVAALASDAPRYAETVQKKVELARSSTIGRLPQLLGGLSKRFEDASSQVAPPAPAAREPDTPRPVPVVVEEAATSPWELALRVLEPILAPLETTVIVLVVAIFILLQREDLRDRLIRLFGSSDLHRTTTAMDEAAARLSRYFLTQLALNAGFGTVIGLGLSLIGVPSPVLWGILAALMRFIPYIGAFIAGLPPLLLAAAVDPGWSMAIWTIGLFVVAEPFMGYVVEPLVYGHSTGLSPVSVIVAAIFWTWLWGPIGLILSTPLTLCLVVLGRHVHRLEFLDVMLGDRPALSPPESFYQRMLAGDPDEVFDQAELLLQERSLSSYYDEVALKGLQLAAADAARGALAPAQLAHMKEAVTALIGDLADHDDVSDPNAPGEDGPLPPSLAEQELPAAGMPASGSPILPPSWTARGAVLCLPGRGPLDEAAAAMLTQLLEKHGLGARLLPFQAASRDRIEALDLQGVRMVCISYLDIAGTPAHLRSLLRRLRRRLPGVPILVGLWPANHAVFTGGDARGLVGADHYTQSLRESIEQCLAEAARAQDDEENGPDALLAQNAG
jgi:predicted PurR-regulated permease PerM